MIGEEPDTEAVCWCGAADVVAGASAAAGLNGGRAAACLTTAGLVSAGFISALFVSAGFGGAGFGFLSAGVSGASRAVGPTPPGGAPLRPAARTAPLSRGGAPAPPL